MRSEASRFVLLVAVAFASLSPAIYWIAYGTLPFLFLGESGIVETIAAVSCAGAAIVFIFDACRSSSSSALLRFWLVMLGLTSFFIAGEEISWGQAFFGFETSAELAEANFQGEFNLHNSKLFQAENNFLSSLFMKLLVLYLLILPLFLSVFPTARRIYDLFRVPTPSLKIALIVLCAIMANYLNMKLVYGVTLVEDTYRVGEMMESILEFCLLVLALEGLTRREEGKETCPLRSTHGLG